MPTLSKAGAELHRSGVTISRVASALDYSVQYVSLQLRGTRRLDPALPAVVRALTDADTADRVLALIPKAGAK